MHLLTLLPLLALTTALPAPSFLIIEASDSTLSLDATPPTSNNTACSPAVLALASGIQSNIADQYNELATVTALGSVLAQNPVDTTLYAATQGSLLGFVTSGIAIRENNQRIAPAGNGAVAGLAIVAAAQMAELGLTVSLGLGGCGVDVAKANDVSAVLILNTFFFFWKRKSKREGRWG